MTFLSFYQFDKPKPGEALLDPRSGIDMEALKNLSVLIPSIKFQLGNARNQSDENVSIVTIPIGFTCGYNGYEPIKDRFISMKHGDTIYVINPETSSINFFTLQNNELRRYEMKSHFYCRIVKVENI